MTVAYFNTDGAALFYASHFRPETYANLRRYVIHRLLWNGDGEKGATSTRGTFPVRAEVVERDLVFVPAGRPR